MLRITSSLEDHRAFMTENGEVCGNALNIDRKEFYYRIIDTKKSGSIPDGVLISKDTARMIFIFRLLSRYSRYSVHILSIDFSPFSNVSVK